MGLTSGFRAKSHRICGVRWGLSHFAAVWYTPRMADKMKKVLDDLERKRKQREIDRRYYPGWKSNEELRAQRDKKKVANAFAAPTFLEQQANALRAQRAQGAAGTKRTMNVLPTKRKQAKGKRKQAELLAQRVAKRAQAKRYQGARDKLAAIQKRRKDRDAAMKAQGGHPQSLGGRAKKLKTPSWKSRLAQMNRNRKAAGLKEFSDVKEMQDAGRTITVPKGGMKYGDSQSSYDPHGTPLGTKGINTPMARARAAQKAQADRAGARERQRRAAGRASSLAGPRGSGSAGRSSYR